MTKQEIIDALDVAKRLQELIPQLPETLLEAHNQMSDAVSEILCDTIDAQGALGIILQALKAEADPGQLRELIVTNEQLQLDVDDALRQLTERDEEIERLTATLDGTRNQLRATEDDLAYYKKQTLAAYAAVDDVPEDSSTEGEIDAEEAPAAPAKKPRKATPRHTWTAMEDRWIAEHLNSARSREVAERFGVSEKAAYARMTIVRKRSGK